MLNWLSKYKPLLFALLSTTLFLCYCITIFFPNYQKDARKFEVRFQSLEQELENYLYKHAYQLKSAETDNLWSLTESSPTFCYVHVFQNDSLIYWNTNHLPTLRFSDIHFPADGILHLQNGWYYCKTHTVKNKVICTSFLIKHDFAYQNNELKNDFSKQLKFPYEATISFEQDSKYAIHDKHGHFLFAAVPTGHQLVSDFHSKTLLLVLIVSLVAWLFYVYKLSFRLSFFRKIGVILLVVLLRLLSLKFNWFDFMNGIKSTQTSLFHLNQFFPNYLELVIHVLCFVFVVFSVISVFKVAVKTKKVIGFLFFLLIVPFSLFVTYLSKGLIENSTITLSIERIFSFDFYSFVSLLLIGVLLYAQYTFTVQIITLNKRLENHVLNLGIIAMIAFFALYFCISHWEGAQEVTFLNGCVTLLVVYFVYKNTKRFQLGFDILVLALFSLITAENLTHFNTEKERIEREFFARKISNERDIETETAYSKIVHVINNDHFLQKLIKSPIRLSLSDFEYRMERRIFNNYWERYDMNFFLFDKYGQSLISEDTNKQITYFNDLENLVTKHGIPSEIDSNIFYISDHSGQFSYIIRQEIAGKDSTKSLFFCTLKSKKIPEEIGFPRLLIPSKAQILEPFENYAIAKYHDGKLVTKYGQFNFPLSFNSVKFWPVTALNNYASFEGYSHYIYRQSDLDYIVVSSKNVTWLEFLTAFSFLFCVFGCCLIPFLFRKQDFFKLKHTVSLAVKIQLVLVSLVFFSLLVSGWGSGLFVRNQYDEFSDLVLKDKLSSVNNDLLNVLGNKQNLAINEEGDYLDFLTQHIAKVFATDVNFYDQNGFLLSTSRPKVFNLGLISEQMNPIALSAFLFQTKSDFAQEEQIGNLSYTSAYLPFYNSNRKLLGFLNLQQFGQQKEFEHQIQKFLASIINVFVLLLVVSIVLAIFVSEWLTAPLRKLQDNFAAIRFGQHNTPITYEKADEIGTLVKAYNQKLAELESAAQLLLKSERESAWREMAQQVAHEIKNPLTPMKLGIQQLLRVYDPANPNSQKQLQKVAQSMIEQIDSLTRIANEFSSFAKMPLPNQVELDLLPLIRTVIDFFNQDATVVITFETDLTHANIKADKDQMIRTFNNLIKNAIQSIPPEKKGLILIRVEEQKDWFHISIKDNGTGISQEKWETLFVPYFTTKSHGSGLGLAIVKQIVENHEGSVSFESKLGVGTVFHLELPTLRH
jgi:two-component system nitrogen regulation sensor histidine kinase NtrY